MLSQGQVPEAVEYSLSGAMTRPVPPRTTISHRMLILASWSLTLLLHILGVVLFVWLASHPGSVLRSISGSSRPELVRATLLSADWRSAHSGIADSKTADAAVKPAPTRVSSDAPELSTQGASKPKPSALPASQQRRNPKHEQVSSSPVPHPRKAVHHVPVDVPSTPAVTAIPASQPTVTTAESTGAVASKEKETNQSMTKPSNASPQKMDLEPFSVAVEPGGPVITQARYRGTPIPEEYPLMARRRGWQGTVMVEVWLDANGEQIKREILQSSGYALLDQAALRSVARNQFTPYTINGVGHPARLHLPVIYTLTAQ